MSARAPAPSVIAAVVFALASWGGPIMPGNSSIRRLLQRGTTVSENLMKQAASHARCTVNLQPA
jgi:hypothetical protein